MNQALFPSSFALPAAAPLTAVTRSLEARSGPRRPAARPSRRPPSRASLWAQHDEISRLRRLRSLLSLFALYASSLLVVVLVSEGADIGCILGGIAGHVLFATHRIFQTWRDAASLEDAKARVTLLTLRPRTA